MSAAQRHGEPGRAGLPLRAAGAARNERSPGSVAPQAANSTGDGRATTAGQLHAPRRRVHAFTLLELLAASALAAALMVVMLQVIASLARGRVVFERQTAAGPAPWQAGLVENVRWDLLNATDGTAAPNRLRVESHGSLDRATLAPGHRPVTVVYALERLGGRTWLVRRQSPRGGTTNERGWSELLCPDVTAFAVEPVEAPPPAGIPGRLRRRPSGPASLDTSTRSVRLRVDGPSGTIVDEVVVLR